jgi:hypothetical protein
MTATLTAVCDRCRETIDSGPFVLNIEAGAPQPGWPLDHDQAGLRVRGTGTSVLPTRPGACCCCTGRTSASSSSPGRCRGMVSVRTGTSREPTMNRQRDPKPTELPLHFVPIATAVLVSGLAQYVIREAVVEGQIRWRAKGNHIHVWLPDVARLTAARSADS